MIFDVIKNLKSYSSVRHVSQVIDFLHREDLSTLKDPEIEICGRDLFVRVMRYHPQAVDANKFETHRTYADIQVMMQGKELMQYAPHNHPHSHLTPYDQTRDCQFHDIKEGITNLIVKAGEFVVFYPGEFHRPSCLVADYHGENIKLVFKIRMEQ